jgi:hypothetical protein
MVKVNANELILVFYNTLDCINPGATEKRNLETMKVQLSDLLYLNIVYVFVLAHNIIGIKNVHHYSDMCFSYLVVQCRMCIHLCHTHDMSQWLILSHELTFLGIHLFKYPIEKSDIGASQ